MNVSLATATNLYKSVFIISAALRCRDPGTPDDGAMGGSNFRIGSQVQFFCHTGYKLIGDAIRTCLPSGLWSGNQPVCDKGGKRSLFLY